MEVVISPSKNKNKKYKAEIDGKKIIHFGHSSYQDYTQHKDPKRKENYISRHAKNEDWSKSNIASAGFMSRHILWEKPTLKGSIDNLNSKYKNVKFKYKNI